MNDEIKEPLKIANVFNHLNIYIYIWQIWMI